MTTRTFPPALGLFQSKVCQRFVVLNETKGLGFSERDPSLHSG